MTFVSFFNNLFNAIYIYIYIVSFTLQIGIVGT